MSLLQHLRVAQATPPGLEPNEVPAPQPEQIEVLIESAQTTGCRREELCR